MKVSNGNGRQTLRVANGVSNGNGRQTLRVANGVSNGNGRRTLRVRLALHISCAEIC